MLIGLRQGSEPEISPEAFDTIRRVMKSRFGFALEGYKDKCVRRRINIRVRSTQSLSAEAYSSLLVESAAEQERLLRVLTINVSHFFRNPSTFEKIAAEILPLILQRRAGNGVLIQSVGCASGEEPYSLAMMLRERFPKAAGSGEVVIRASDVDAASIEAAKAGLYHPDRLTEVPPELKTRWFAPEGGQFRLSDEIRALVDFRYADLNDGVILEKSDLVICRNVLIYFERGRQEAILNGFADALGDGGCLVLGKSETLFGTARRRFRTVCPVERIYRVVKGEG